MADRGTTKEGGADTYTRDRKIQLYDIDCQFKGGCSHVRIITINGI